MPRIKDDRIKLARKQRNERIKNRFESLYNSGLRIECVTDKLINEFGLSESTINQIINNYGNYKN